MVKSATNALFFAAANALFLDRDGAKNVGVTFVVEVLLGSANLVVPVVMVILDGAKYILRIQTFMYSAKASVDNVMLINTRMKIMSQSLIIRVVTTMILKWIPFKKLVRQTDT